MTSLTPRYVLTLIEHLPQDSAFVASIRGGRQHRGWGVGEYLLAHLIDAVNANTFVLTSAHSKVKPKRPEPVQRPGTRQGKADMFRMHMAAKKHAKAVKDG